jgi:hypothetical protein
MTILMEQALRARNVRVHATFADRRSLSLGDAEGRLSALRSLVWVAAFSTTPRLEVPPRPLAWVRDLRLRSSVADVVARRSRIERLTYNSPMEVVLLVTGITATATLTADRLIATFTRFQRARIQKAEADVMTEAAKHIVSRMRADVPHEWALHDQAVRRNMTDAALGLLEIANIQILDEEED